MSCFHFAVQLKYWKICVFVSARLILGIFVAASFMKLQYAVRKHCGTSLALIATMMSTSQFHFLFYATRTLPNIFALVLGEWSNRLNLFLSVGMGLTVRNVYLSSARNGRWKVYLYLRKKNFMPCTRNKPVLFYLLNKAYLYFAKVKWKKCFSLFSCYSWGLNVVLTAHTGLYLIFAMWVQTVISNC